VPVWVYCTTALSLGSGSVCGVAGEAAGAPPIGPAAVSGTATWFGSCATNRSQAWRHPSSVLGKRSVGALGSCRSQMPKKPSP
jgi:hypothetical protein